MVFRTILSSKKGVQGDVFLIDRADFSSCNDRITISNFVIKLQDTGYYITPHNDRFCWGNDEKQLCAGALGYTG